MPIYEYSCSQCEADFELLIRFDETPHCPTCGEVHVEKKMSVPAAHSNGSSSLPVCGPAAREQTCGLPRCQMGGCQME